MNTRLVRTLLVLFVVSFFQSSFAQGIRRLAISGEVFRIPEIGALIAQEDDQLKAVMAMPENMRLKAYTEVDIKQNDIILYLNGKRTKTIKELEDKYNEIEIGELVQIGVRRGDERFITSFKKADPKDLPQVKMVRVGEGGEMDHADGGGMRISRTMTSDGESLENVTPVIELGITINDEKGKVKIAEKLPIPTPGLESDMLQKGDVIESLNGKKVESAKQFARLFEGIKVGDKVALAYSRGENKLNASFKKPEARGRIMIRTDREEN